MADSKGRVSVSIEGLAAWAYGKCLVHRMDAGSIGLHEIESVAGGAEYHGVSGDGVAQVIKQAQLGTKIDGGGGMVPIMDAPNDAIALHRYVLTLDAPIARLVIVNGGFGAWPDPGKDGPDFRAYAAMFDEKGRPETWRTAGCRPVEYTPISWVDERPAREAARERYASWWYAMFGAVALFRSKPDLLTKYRVVRQDAPQKPWGETIPTSPPVFVGVDLGQKRDRMSYFVPRRGLAA